MFAAIFLGKLAPPKHSAALKQVRKGFLYGPSSGFS